MTIEQRIERALIRFLKEEKNIDAVSAYLDDTKSADPSSGCDTCGYGGIGMSFNIYYRKDGAISGNILNIEGDPLWFIPTIYKYDTED